jgi:hypothetical protein
MKHFDRFARTLLPDPSIAHAVAEVVGSLNWIGLQPWHAGMLGCNKRANPQSWA